MPYGLDIYDYDEKKHGQYTYLSGAQWATPIYRPLYAELWLGMASRFGVLASADIGMFPTQWGWDFLLANGHFYVRVIPTTEEERKAREPLWRERLAPVLEDPFGYYESFKPRLKQIYDPLFSFDVEKATDYELADHFCDCWDMQRRVHQIHHTSERVLDQGAALFQILCKDLTGITPSDVKFAKLMSGFDSTLLRSNKALAELASRALELELKGLFDTLEPEELLAKLEESKTGRQWLTQFHDYLKVWGMRPPRVQDFTITWIEKPSLAIPDIRRLMAAGGVHAPDMVRESLVAEREKTEKEVLAMIPEEQRDWFEKLMRCAQAAHYWSEDHIEWIEHYAFYLLRRAVVELGRRFVRARIMDDPEDVFFLLHHEIIYALPLAKGLDLRPIVKKRKEEWERNLNTELPPILGDPTKIAEQIAACPAISIAMGVPIATPEEVGATLVGAAGAPGEVEGIARVIMTFNDIDQLQPGEILITPFTAAPWTPAFGVTKAVVTDFGGGLCHTTIVAREYGIPAVVGTMEATAKVKSGDRIRVDGNLLRVYVLE